MAQIDVPLSRSGFGQTRRVDNWWVQPVVVFLVSFCIHRLCHLGGVPRAALPLRAVSLAFLLAGIVRSRRLVWPNAELDAGLGYGRDAHPVGAGRISSHLLLLPRGLLQSFLGRPAFLYGRRAAEDLSRRTILSFDHAKHSPLFSLSGAAVSRSFLDATCGTRSGSMAGSVSASALWSCWLTSCC